MEVLDYYMEVRFVSGVDWFCYKNNLHNFIIRKDNV